MPESSSVQMARIDERLKNLDSRIARLEKALYTLLFIFITAIVTVVVTNNASQPEAQTAQPVQQQQQQQDGGSNAK